MSDPVAGVKVLLLAAGIGTRLRPLTESTPKCLVRVGGRPLLDYWFERCAQAGLAELLINTHHLRDQVGAYIARQRAAGFNVDELYEHDLLGSAGTIRASRDFAVDAADCLIIYADNLSTIDLAALVRFHRGHSDPLTMALFRTRRPAACGIATLDDTSRVVEFVEKPAKPRSDLANAGVYVVTADAYREIADMECFDLGFDVLPRFVGRMRGWLWNGYHRDIGTLEALERAERDVAEGLFR